jgi:hypothetical protein
MATKEIDINKLKQAINKVSPKALESIYPIRDEWRNEEKIINAGFNLREYHVFLNMLMNKNIKLPTNISADVYIEYQKE